MHWARFYTQAGRDIFNGVRFRAVASEQQLEYIVPQRWNQAAVDVLLEKVFYPETLPALTKKVAEAGVPAWLWRSEVDDTGLDSISAEWRYRHEHDIREVLHRMAGAVTYRAWKDRLFSTDADAEVFYDELRYIFLHQIAAPELEQWRLLGLDWAYGLTGVAALNPRHRIVPFDAGKSHALKRMKILGDTLALDPVSPKTGVTLPVENIDSPAFIAWKRDSDIRQVAESLGRKMLETAAYHVMDACDRDSFFGFDPARNPGLSRAVDEARQSGLSEAAIRMAISYAEQGYEEISFPVPEEDQSAAQCIKTVLSVPDDFVEAALTGHSILLYEAGEPQRHYPAQKLWDGLAEAVWSSGEPAVSFRSSVESSNVTGQPLFCDTTGGFVFVADSAAPSATVNLLACAYPLPNPLPEGEGTVRARLFPPLPSGEGRGEGILDIAALRHVTRIMTVALDAVSGGGEYRPLMLGMTNIAAVLMGKGIAYDSDAGRTAAALAAALVSGCAYQASAEIAVEKGAFPAYPRQAKIYLQNIKDKLAALAGTSFLQKGMTRRPVQIRTTLCPDSDLVEAVKQAWENAYRTGKETGFRHAHLTGIDTDPAVQALLNGQTQDIMPEQALVRFEGYFSDTLEGAQLYGKKLNPMAPRALARLGYTAAEREDIHFYAVGHGTLLDAPHINHKSLREKGFHQAALDAVESALATALHIRYAFNKWTLGEEFCRRVLGFSAEELESGTFDMLAALGFSEDHIEAANIYCCGTMTFEGAPHLKPDHLAVFDCVAPCASFGVRRVSPDAQIKMQAALETFLSGAAAHTVLLSHHATIEEVQKLLLTGWELGVKCLRLYRDGCSLLHPLVLPAIKTETVKEEDKESLPCPKQSITA
jgi:ribonucleoside-diphosphate reductase alpha chain